MYKLDLPGITTSGIIETLTFCTPKYLEKGNKKKNDVIMIFIDDKLILLR